MSIRKRSNSSMLIVIVAIAVMYGVISHRAGRQLPVPVLRPNVQIYADSSLRPLLHRVYTDWQYRRRPAALRLMPGAFIQQVLERGERPDLLLLSEEQVQHNTAFFDSLQWTPQAQILHRRPNPADSTQPASQTAHIWQVFKLSELRGVEQAYDHLLGSLQTDSVLMSHWEVETIPAP